MSTEAPYILERDLPARVVVLGDLNAQHATLRRVLVDLKLIHKRTGAWTGGKTVFVQMGDVPNRGPAARAAMDLLLDLRPQALEAGGDVYWLLGNHEVMSALGHEAYVTAEEYLEFAEPLEIDRFLLERTRFLYSLLGPPDVPEIVPPIGGRVRAWEEANAPGQDAYRRAMGPFGRYGRAIRKLPVAFRLGTLLFVHGGLSPSWAVHGVEGLARLARDAWAVRPQRYQDLDVNGVFRDPLGPLWHRAYCVAKAKTVRQDLEVALELTRARFMFVGHTRTDSVEGGETGQPLLCQQGQVVMTDVGIGEAGEAGAAVVIEKHRIEAWTPGGARSKLASLPRRGGSRR